MTVTPLTAVLRETSRTADHDVIVFAYAAPGVAAERSIASSKAPDAIILGQDIEH